VLFLRSNEEFDQDAGESYEESAEGKTGIPVVVFFGLCFFFLFLVPNLSVVRPLVHPQLFVHVILSFMFASFSPHPYSF